MDERGRERHDERSGQRGGERERSCRVDASPPPLTPAECLGVADFLQGFANPVRIRILCCLHAGPRSVSEVSAETGEKTSNVSQQLKILLQKGYVTRRKTQRRVFYEIRDPAICELMRLVRDIVFPAAAAERK